MNIFSVHFGDTEWYKTQGKRSLFLKVVYTANK